jgi:hypothetical protein
MSSGRVPTRAEVRAPLARGSGSNLANLAKPWNALGRGE